MIGLLLNSLCLQLVRVTLFRCPKGVTVTDLDCAHLSRKRKLLERKVRRDMGGASENDDDDSCSDYDGGEEDDEYDRNVSTAVARNQACRLNG